MRDKGVVAQDLTLPLSLTGYQHFKPQGHRYGLTLKRSRCH